jgi:hypothetical protein
MSIKDQVKAIDRQSCEIIRQLEVTVQPLARATEALLRTFGHKRGHHFLGKRRLEYRSDGLYILKYIDIFSDDDVQVFYEGALVLKFDDLLDLIDLGRRRERDRKYLFVYRPGPWEQKVVSEYRRAKLVGLKDNYGVDDEDCKWFNHDTGGCGAESGLDHECPCPDFEAVREGE